MRPALPLDQAGPYVAAVYVIFLGLVLTYVAIMAARLGSLEKDLAEINAALAEHEETPTPEPVP